MIHDDRYFSDLKLSKRLERAEAHASAKFVEARARLFPECKAEWIEVASAYAMFDGVDSPITQTFGLGLFETVGEPEMDEIEAFFFSRDSDVFHEVSPLAGLPLVELLNSRGYRPVELSSVLYRPLQPADGTSLLAINQDMRVRPIKDDEGPVWIDTTVKGWSEHPEAADYLASIGPVCTQREDAVSFLVELGDRPIGAGAMSIFGGVGLLAGACTIPEFRNQGAQFALMDYRLRYAAQQGCEVAMMCALPGSSSQRNGERHGFRIAYTRVKWHLERKS